MTPEQFSLIQRLSKCTFLPGSFEKRFVRNLAEYTVKDEISAKQQRYLEKLHYRYRRQLHEPDFPMPEWMVRERAREREEADIKRLAQWNAGRMR